MREKYDEITDVLIIEVEKLQRKQSIINKIKKELAEYRVIGGRVQELFENPTLFYDADLREVLLFCEQVFLITKNKNLKIQNLFTENEIKEARQYDGLLGFEGELIDFPLTFDRVIRLSDKEYVTTISVSEISKMMDNKLLNYNFEIQREGTKVKRRNGFILVPTIVKRNVKEISDLLQKEQLRSTMIAFNAAIRTADDGEELFYDHKEGTLTINKGTRLDILDGMHRCFGAKTAYSINPEIDFDFVVSITNFSTSEAQSYQRQIAKATPISITRQKELETDNLANTVINSLNSDSELQGRISQASRPRYFANEIVTYEVLLQGIDREFKMVSRLEAYEIADYLKKFFEYLFGTFSEHFIINVEENLKTSLLGYNKMFIGYLILARRMRDKNIPLKEINNIIKKEYFLRNSKKMSEYGIVKEGKLCRDVEDCIIDFFEQLPLGCEQLLLEVESWYV